MALYEYRCPEGHSLEVFHRMQDTPAVRCDICGASAERILTPPMIHTQYYFSPQVRGAKRPRWRPDEQGPAEEPAEEKRAGHTRSGEQRPDGH